MKAGVFDFMNKKKLIRYNDNNERLCTKCEEWKDISYFPKNNEMKDKLSSHCNACKAKNTKEWYKKNKDKIKNKVKIRNHEYWEKNKDKIRAYRQKNKDKLKLYQQKRYRQNKRRLEEIKRRRNEEIIANENLLC